MKKTTPYFINKLTFQNNKSKDKRKNCADCLTSIRIDFCVKFGPIIYPFFKFDLLQISKEINKIYTCLTSEVQKEWQKDDSIWGTRVINRITR